MLVVLKIYRERGREGGREGGRDEGKEPIPKALFLRHANKHQHSLQRIILEKDSGMLTGNCLL